MTDYAVSTIPFGPPGASGVWGLGILAGTYRLRLVKVEGISTAGQASPSAWISRYSGATLHGATSATCVPMRQDGPSATATASYTTAVFSSPNYTPSGSAPSGTATILSYIAGVAAPGVASYEFPLDLTVSPGSALWFSLIPPGTSYSNSGYWLAYLNVYFEELREDWTF